VVASALAAAAGVGDLSSVASVMLVWLQALILRNLVEQPVVAGLLESLTEYRLVVMQVVSQVVVWESAGVPDHSYPDQHHHQHLELHQIVYHPAAADHQQQEQAWEQKDVVSVVYHHRRRHHHHQTVQEKIYPVPC